MDIFKGLLQTVVGIQTQLLIFGNDLFRVRMEIDDVVVQLRHRHQLLTDEFGPYFTLYIFVLVNTVSDGIRPRRSRIGDNDIMLIRYTHTGDLEDGCVCLRSVAVKLIIRSVIFNPRRTTVRALVAGNLIRHTMQIVGGRQLGVLHIRYGVVRPAVTTARTRRFEQT